MKPLSFPNKAEKGAIHFTDDLSKIQEELRENNKGFRKHKEERGSHRATPAHISAPSVPIEVPGIISNSGEVQVPFIPVSDGNFFVDCYSMAGSKLVSCSTLARLLLHSLRDRSQKLGIFNSGASAEMPFNTADGEEWIVAGCWLLVAGCWLPCKPLTQEAHNHNWLRPLLESILIKGIIYLLPKSYFQLPSL